MIEHALNSNNDMVIINGSFATVKDGAQVTQHARTRLLFYLGEWFADLNSGTPWLQEVFIKPFNPGNVENIIKSRIANTPELNKITEFSMELPDPAKRQLKISFSAETRYGSINSEELYINV